MKTRLAAAIGPKIAAEVYLGCLRCSLGRFSQLGCRRLVAYSPPEKRAAFESVLPTGWGLVEQSSGDLGARMSRFFEQRCLAGDRRVVVVGSDSPSLSIERISAAFELLEDVPVVLGPSEDGGYYLVGLNQPIPELFEGIEWGGERVLEQSLAVLRRVGASAELLPGWYDLDVEADLQRLRAELASDPGIDSHLRELLETLK